MRTLLTLLAALLLNGGAAIAQNAPVTAPPTPPPSPRIPLVDLARQIAQGPFGDNPNLALLEAGGCQKVLTQAGYAPTDTNCAELQNLLNAMRTPTGGAR